LFPDVLKDRIAFECEEDRFLRNSVKIQSGSLVLYRRLKNNVSSVRSTIKITNLAFYRTLQSVSLSRPWHLAL